MATITELRGVNKLITRLEKMSKEASKNTETVIVGFSQRYAIIVHEDLTAFHKVGHAKFLEGPARGMRRQLAKMIETVYKKTKDMGKALLFAGYALLREAQLSVPVDTSALKASGFVALEKDWRAEAQRTFVKSEAIRLKATRKKAAKSVKRSLSATAKMAKRVAKATKKAKKTRKKKKR